MSNEPELTPPPPPASPPPVERRERQRQAEAQAAALLEVLVNLVGAPWDPGRGATVIAQLGVEALAEPVRFARVCASLGLRATRWRGTLGELGDVVRPGMPVALVDRFGEWAVLDGQLRLVRPASGAPPATLSLDALGQRLGLGEHQEHEVFLIERLSPAEGFLGGAKDASDGHVNPFVRLGAMLRAERDDLGVVVLYAAAVGVLTLATPLTVQVLINTVAFGAFRQPIVVLAILLLAALGLAAALKALQLTTVELLQRRVFVRLVSDLSWRLPRVRIESFERDRGSELLNRFFDVLTVQKASASLLVEGVSALLQAAVGLVLLALYHPYLLAFDLLLVAGILVIVFVAGRDGPKTALKESKAKYAVAGWLEEVALATRLFRMPGGAELAMRRADELSCAYLKARDEHWRVVFKQILASLGLQAIAGTALLGMGGFLVLDGQLTLGQLVAAELIVASSLAGFSKLTSKLETFYDLVAAVDKLGTLVELRTEPVDGLPVPEGEGPASLEAQGVALRMRSGARPIVGLNLQLKAGEHVAILGLDGAGKSLVADLLAGVRLPTEGVVSLDGQPLHTLRPDELREQVVLVRGVELFMGTLAENLGFGRADISLADMERALRQVDLWDAVRALPAGLQTELQPGGAPLSTNQILRLSLARAVLTRPRLLLADRVLDALPVNQRAPLIAGLTDESAPWTLALFTQDAELARRCSRRLLLTDGALVELDSSADLSLFSPASTPPGDA